MIATKCNDVHFKTNESQGVPKRMAGVLVGIDVGTTSTKAVVTDLSGAVISRSRIPIAWGQKDGRTELDPRTLVVAAREAIAEALSRCPGKKVRALGVASMGESGVLLDGRDNPLAPVIAWHDTRDSKEVEELADELGEGEFTATTGLPLRPQWSLTKHRWQVRNMPNVQTAVKRLGVAEWVVRALGGEQVSEQSLASRTGWLRLADRTWWGEAMEWSQTTENLLPDLVAPGTAVGRVTQTDGLAALNDAVLVVAGHDHQAAAVGAGATQPGDVLDSCGTAEALVRTVETGVDAQAIRRLANAGITTGWHVLADRWCLLGGTQGGLALQRVLSLLGLQQGDIERLESESHYHDWVTVHGIDSDELHIHGITDGVRPQDVWCAALHAVNTRSAEVHAEMTAVVGKHRDFIATGGWTRSVGFLAAKRAAFGPVRIASSQEAAADGAARIAGMATGSLDKTPSASVETPTPAGSA